MVAASILPLAGRIISSCGIYLLLYVAPLTHVFEHPCWSILIETSILVYVRAGSVVLVKTLPSCLIHWLCSVGGAQFCVDATQSYVSTRKQVSESMGTGNRFFGSEQF